jgi:hypothetical protein
MKDVLQVEYHFQYFILSLKNILKNRQMGDNLLVIWAEVSTLRLAVLLQCH